MPDYFDRLLARSVPGCPVPSGETVVAPRLPQLFEQFSTEVETEELLPAAVRPAPQAAPVPPPVTVVERHSPASEAPRPEPAVQPPALAPPPVAPSVIPVRVPQTAAAQAPAGVVERQVERPVEQHLTTVNVVLEHHGAPAGTLLPRGTTGAVPATPAPVDTARAATVAARRGEPRQQQVVRVSIGRVEVTATSPERRPPAQARPSRPDPAMSLERYLTREDGRR